MTRSIENVTEIYKLFATDLARMKRNAPTRGKKIIARHADTVRALERQLEALQAEANALGFKIVEEPR
jgi:hypothetical protein